MYHSVEGWPQADALVLPMDAMHDPVEGWPQAGAFVVDL